MDESTPSFSNDYTYQESPKIYIPRPPNTSSSGLTLVLPSLKSLKASQAALKAKNYTPTRSLSIQQDVETQERRQPRPQKLKPLKEVLVKLIAQIKKYVVITPARPTNSSLLKEGRLCFLSFTSRRRQCSGLLRHC